jgi:hypothetical protein
MQNVAITQQAAADAKSKLQHRIAAWMDKLAAVEGFNDWRLAKMREQMIMTLLPKYVPADMNDFDMPAAIRDEHSLVTGYYNVMSAAHSLRETGLYFRRYPFRNNEVSRESHLKTCCELFFSRVYHFRERFIKQLVQLDRNTQPRKMLPLQAIKDQFASDFATILEERNNINHHTGYTDLQLDAIGLADLLSGNDDDFSFMRTPASTYKHVARDWAKRTLVVADKLDLYVGLVAILMLGRCDFLPLQKSSEPPSILET